MSLHRTGVNECAKSSSTHGMCTTITQCTPSDNICTSEWKPIVTCDSAQDGSTYSGYQIELFRLLARCGVVHQLKIMLCTLVRLLCSEGSKVNADSCVMPLQRFTWLHTT